MKRNSDFCEQLIVIALTVMISALAFGQTVQTPAQPNVALGVPRLVKFSGSLKDASGNLLTNTLGITFVVYSEQTGGVPLWQETQNVQFSQGHYTVFLGENTSGGIPAELFAAGQPRWLGVRVLLPGEQEQPRVLLASVPYALKAVDADTLGGLPASAFVRAAEGGSSSVAVAPAAATPSSVALPASSTVTTSGGTVGTIPVFHTATDIENSPITDLAGMINIADPLTVSGALSATSVTAATVTDQSSGVINPLTYGAKCDDSTDDTTAFQNAISAAIAAGKTIMVPSTGASCVVSQLDLTNYNNKVRIVGQNGPIQFISVIRCQEATVGSGVCLDLTGSSYVEIKNIRFQYGSHPPQAVIRMGKSTGNSTPPHNSPNGNSGFIHTENVDIECYGANYGIYNNGGEVWQSIGDVFEGCQYPVVLSGAANGGDVGSPFATVPTSLASMTDVQFFTPFFGADYGNGYGLMLDPGIGGSVEDVAIFGGYGQTTSATHSLFGDKNGSNGPIRGFKVYNFRDEPQGSTGIAPMVNFGNEADGVALEAKFAPVAKPTAAPIQFGLIQDGTINVQPADNQTFYANPFITCAGSYSTVIHISNQYGGGALPNKCIGAFELFNGLQVGNPTGGDKGIGTINVSGGYYVNGTKVLLNRDVGAGGSQAISASDGSVTGSSGGSPRHATCWKAVGQIGYCSSAIGSDGTCICE